MRIKAILFDADGVVQRPTADRQAQFDALIDGPDEDVSKFKSELFTIERPCHNGGDFVSPMRQVVARWKCKGSVEDVLRAWTAIEIDPSIAALVSAVRSSGMPCHLATNQEPYRAQHMRSVMNYGDLFERLFFSCEMGCSKPDPRYFSLILDSLHLEPGSVLFIDDVAANVAAAVSVGIRGEIFAPPSVEDAAAEMRRLLARHHILIGD